jgi:hypothetical protein
VTSNGTTRATIRAGLVAVFNAQVVDELLNAHREAKLNYYLGGLRLSAVEGGRFCEAAFRLLQQQAFGAFDQLGKKLDADNTAKALANIAAGSKPDAVRLHIPRALRVVYDIRNNRDAAHLSDGIDPNLQDATLVVAILDWVLAEFVRLHHSVSADVAHSMVEDLVTRHAPVIQDFDGFLKVLRTDLSARGHCLVLLYQRGKHGATFDELMTWARPEMQKNLRRTLDAIVDEKAWAHRAGGRYAITLSGEHEVDAKGWLRPVEG